VFLRKTDTPQTDEELLQLYRTSRNLTWLSTLFLRYSPLVYGVCLKYLKDRDDAKDSVMQIHEKLIQSLLVHEISNFRSWLYVNARNHCLMQLRSQKGKIKDEISDFLVDNVSLQHPEEDLELEQNMTQLEKCLETLIAAQQLCVRLFYLQEKCYREIGFETGYDLKQVKSYIQNGKRNLKNCMEENARKE
jgi:RNA polymerase sigma factor (sigma-70 family)